MPLLSLDALIKRTQAAIDAESEPKALRVLQANLAAFLATKAEMDDDDGDEDDKDQDEKSKAKKAAEEAAKAKKSAEAAKHRAKAAEWKAKAEEAEEAAKKCEEDDEESEEAKKASAALRQATAHLASLPGGEALGAQLASLGQDIATLKKGREGDEREALIASVQKQTTKAERADLATWPLEVVRGFVATRVKSGLVYTDEEALAKPKAKGKPGTAESLPAETLAMIEQAVGAYPLPDKKEYRATLIAAHIAAAAKTSAEGRY
jgi:hypothetical protein